MPVMQPSLKQQKGNLADDTLAVAFNFERFCKMQIWDSMTEQERFDYQVKRDPFYTKFRWHPATDKTGD